MFDARHCVAMLLTTYFFSYRVAVHHVCVVHVHIFFSYRVAVHCSGVRHTLRKFTPAMLRIAPPPLGRPVGVHPRYPLFREILGNLGNLGKK